MAKKAMHSERKKRLSEPFKGSSEIHKNIRGFPRGVHVGCNSQPGLRLTDLSHLY